MIAAARWRRTGGDGVRAVARTALRAVLRAAAPAILASAVLLCGAPGPAAASSQAFADCGSARVSGAALAEACRRALTAGGLSPRETAFAWTNMGVALAEIGRDGDALTAYDAALRADPGFAPAYFNRALARSAQGMTGAALRDWEAVLRLEPRNAEARLGRGALLLRGGAAAEALREFEAAARDADGPAVEADARFNRALALQALGRSAEAEDALSAALRLAPGDAQILLARGRLRATARRDAAALADYDAAIAAAPEWSAPWAARGMLRDAQGRRDLADLDYLRAFELGAAEDWILQRVQGLR